MIGVFDKNLPKPRYTFIWDVQVVLTYIGNLPSNEELPRKELSKKLATLFALAAASRGSEVAIWNTKSVVKTSTGFKLTFNKVVKSWRKGKRPQSIYRCSRYLPNTKLYVVTTPEHYLQVTKDKR